MKTQSTLEGVYSGSDGRLSSFDLHCAVSDVETGKLAVFAHGYKGFKDWGCWNLVARAFAASGIDFLKFNFSHNGGTVDNPIDFPDLEAFAKNTYSKEVSDLVSVLDVVSEGLDVGGNRRSWKQVLLIGHSRGGGIAALVASRDPRVSGLATWASVADFGERFSFDLDAWRQKGVVTVLNGRTGQEMPHYFSYYEDYQAHIDELHILNAASRVHLPALVVHGEEDEAVAIDNAMRLYRALPQSTLLRIPGAGHTFGASHPWSDTALPPPLQQVVEETVSFAKSIN